jgi:hypothetical protein
MDASEVTTSLLHPTNAKPSRRSIFTSISSRSSITSTSSHSSTPPGCRDFRLRYARDAKGHKLSSSYPYSTPLGSEAASAADIPVSCRDSVRLRYAKDAKGHDFGESYPAQFGRVAKEEEEAALVATIASGRLPNGRDYKINRYAKDGKGIDFTKSYKQSGRFFL